MKGLDDMEELEEHVSFQDILMLMLNGDQDIELKTQITHPRDLASLKAIEIVLKNNKMKKSSELLKSFIDIYLRYMFSYNRQSREETIKALIGIMEQEAIKMSISDKLMTNLKQ